MSKSNVTNSMVSYNHRLEIALGDEKTVDVFFVFNKANRCTRIASHESILSSKSDVFHTMFSDNWNRIEDITITDASAEHFSRFLQTFYDDKNAIQNISERNVREMLYLAHKYNAKHCMDACVMVLSSMVNGKNALYVMELALFYDIYDLIEKCSFQIAADFFRILDTDEFYMCSPNVLKCFLENIDEDDFHCRSYACIPDKISRACMKWAKRRCNDQHIDPKKPGNIRNQLNDVFGNIPFGCMGREEFFPFLADYADVFSVTEIKNICGKIWSE